MSALYINNKPYKIYKLLATICILISPILSNYVFISQVSLGDVMVLVTLPWLFLQLRFNALSAFYIAIPLVIVFASYMILGGPNVYAGFYRAAFYYCIIFLIISVKKINLPYFFEVYGFICLIASVLIIFQWIAYFVFGVSAPFQLPFEYYEPDTLSIIDHVFRAGGLFKEPSYYAIYVIPYIVIVASRVKGWPFFIVSLAGVLSTSSLMFFLIVMSAVLLCLHLFRLYNVLLAFALLAAVSLFLFSNRIFDNYIFFDRVYAIFIDGGTLNDRFLPFLDIFDVANFAPSSETLNFFLSSNLWFNSGASIIAYFGIGGLSFLVFISYKFQLLYGLLFLMLIFSTHFMSSAFSYFIVIAFIVFNKRFVTVLQK